MLRILFSLCVLWVFTGNVAADEPPLIDQFIGSWTSSGDAFGGPAKSAMTWSPVLNGKFIRLDYRIDMLRSDQTAVFEGAAYYKYEGDDRWSAFWADNSGDLYRVSAIRDGNAIISHWGVEGSKYGRTRYELTPNGEMEVTDWIETGEGWKQFNRNTFTRIETAD